MLTNLAESAGKEDHPAIQPPPLKLPVGAGGGKVERMYPKPKDSNVAVWVRNHATLKALQGADRQTDRQTDFPPIIVR